MRRLMALALMVAACLIASIRAEAAGNLVANGGFDQSSFAGPFATYGGGTSSLSGWMIGGDSVDLIQSYWTPQSGSYSLDLSGNGPGAIQQYITTVPGKQYNFSFWYSANPDNPVQPKVAFTAQFGSTIVPIILPEFSSSLSNMNWLQYTGTFTATAPMTLVSFSSTNAGPYGTALDSISASPVPLPGIAWLLGGGIAAVLGLRRRLG